MSLLLLIILVAIFAGCSQPEAPWTPDWDSAVVPDKTIGFTILSDSNGKLAFSWPFETPAKAEMSLNVNEPSHGGQQVDFVLKEDKGGETFVVFASSGCVISSGKYGFRISGTKSGDYILFPSVPNMCLTKVEVTTGNEDSMRSPSITDAVGGSVVGGDMFIDEFDKAGDSHSWTLYDTQKGVRYRMNFNYPGVASIRSLTLTYSGKPKTAPAAGRHEPLEDYWPDFSRVGYMWSDKPIPELPVVRTIEAPADGEDATEYIQKAIDEFPGEGALLLKAGHYYVSGQLKIERSNFVLRGEGTSTVLHATGTSDRNFLLFGHDSHYVFDRQSSTRITVSRLAVGQLWVPVRNPENFSVGDRIVIWRPATDKWIHDLKMDQIPQNAENRVEQWKAEDFGMTWERIITDIQGDRLFVDAPVVMEVSDEYGGGYVMKCSRERITGSGIENIAFESDFDETVVDEQGRWTDEQHAKSAIVVFGAEHCWISGVTASHFLFATVHLHSASKNITVQNCHSKMPVSLVTGSRRYAFQMHQCQLCLVKDCLCEHDRHGYAAGARTPGPNVYLRCEGRNMLNEFGPHQRWSTGMLYDNCVSDKGLIVQDRSHYGTGHGWAGTNIFFYNCDVSVLICQSPWVTGKNWCIGCTGEKRENTSQGLERPSGEWISYGTRYSPLSLYESQLEERHGNNIFLAK